uniref:titin-like n=1 Tax=Myxine glutinosa TaxID=7769 RepID=UPI00358F2F78
MDTRRQPHSPSTIGPGLVTAISPQQQNGIPFHTPISISSGSPSFIHSHMQAPLSPADVPSNMPAVPPTYVSGLRDMVIAEGERVSLECWLQGSPEPTVQWFRDEFPINNSADFQVRLEKGLASLTIAEVFPEDSGHFSCVASNTAGHARSTCFLKVQAMHEEVEEDAPSKVTVDSAQEHPTVIPVPAPSSEQQMSSQPLEELPPGESPPLFAQKPSTQLLVEGWPATFHCQVLGVPPPYTYWKKGKIPLSSGYRYKMRSDARSGDYYLDISITFPDDAGEYICVARNKHGEAQASSLLLEKADYEAFKKHGKLPVKQNGVATLKPLQVDTTAAAHLGSEILKHHQNKSAMKKMSVTSPKEQGWSELAFEARLIREIEMRIVQQNLNKIIGEDSEQQPVDPAEDEGACEPRFESRMSSQEVEEGRPVILSCQVFGYPAPKMMWYKDGQQICPGPDNNLQVTPDGVTSLHIGVAHHEHEGIYTVLAFNLRGNIICSAKLSVLTTPQAPSAPQLPQSTAPRFQIPPAPAPEPSLEEALQAMPLEKLYRPVFVQKPLPVCVLEGTVARFDVKAVGRPMPETFWLHNGQPLHNDQVHKTVIKEDGTQSLIISPVSLDDQGDWTVVALNKAGKATTTVPLVVEAKEMLMRPHFLERLQNVSIHEGGTVYLSAKAAGKPIPDLVWLKNNEIIHPHKNSKIMIEDAMGESRLILSGAIPTDSAWYAVTAINRAGRAMTRCKVIVESKVRRKADADRRLFMPRGVYREIAAPVLEPLHSRYGQEQWEDGDLFDGNLEQPPCFKRKVQSLKLKHFGPAIFECQLIPIGDPSIVVEWLHDGRPIQAANRVRMVCEFGYCSLIYDVAYPRDSGVISCIASNLYGSDRTSATLVVKEEKSLVEETQLPEGQRGVQRLRDLERSTAAALAAVAAVTEDVPLENEKPQIVMHPEPCRLHESEQARYRCRVTGQPPPKVSWFLNGRQIHKSKRFRIHYDGIHYLEIMDCKTYDTGNIRLFAENTEGCVETTVCLEVAPREDFRMVLRKANPSHHHETASGKLTFGIVKEDSSAESDKQSQDQEVVKLKKAGRITYEKQSEETEELQSKFKRRKEEGYYEAMAGMDQRSQRKSSDYKDMLRQRRESLVHRIKEESEEENNPDIVESKASVQGVKTEREPLLPGMEAPQFLERIASQTVPEGGEANFQVRIEGNPQPECQWLKNSVKIELSDRICWRWLEEDVCELVIKDATSGDSASITCRAANVVGDVSCHAFLLVQTKPVIIFLQELSDVIAKEKDTLATFEGELSEPFYKVKWYKAGQQLEDGDKYRMHSDRCVHLLSVLIICPEDAGEYSCKLAEDPSICSKAQLLVEGSPLELLKELVDVEVLEGHSAEFECQLSRDDISGTWSHMGNDVTLGERLTEAARRGRCTLTIREARSGDQGTYSFQAGDKITSAFLCVRPRPVALLQALADVAVCETEPARLDVRLSQDGPKGVWKKDGHEIGPDDDRYCTSTEGPARSLIINQVSKEDGGVFAFSISALELETSATLKVQVVEVVHHLKDITMVEGSRLVLECKLSVPEVRTGQWLRDGCALGASEHVQRIVKGTKHRLVIARVQLGDAGHYNFIVGKVHSECQLCVQEVSIVRCATDQVSEKLKEVTFEVELSHAGVEALWLFGEQELRPGERFRIRVQGATHQLTVLRVSGADQGIYTFVAGNKRSPANLSITG